MHKLIYRRCGDNLTAKHLYIIQESGVVQRVIEEVILCDLPGEFHAARVYVQVGAVGAGVEKHPTRITGL